MATTHVSIVSNPVTGMTSAFQTTTVAGWSVSVHSYPSHSDFGGRVEMSAFRKVDGVMCVYSMSLPTEAARSLAEMLEEVLR